MGTAWRASRRSMTFSLKFSSVPWLVGITKERVEEFSFALAVFLTPPVNGAGGLETFEGLVCLAVSGRGVLPFSPPSLLGMVFSCIAGLLALIWLSRWLEEGRWQFFGFYCLCAAAAVLWLHKIGF